MPAYSSDSSGASPIAIAPDVMDYIEKRDCDFRVCTSCGFYKGKLVKVIKVKTKEKE